MSKIIPVPLSLRDRPEIVQFFEAVRSRLDTHDALQTSAVLQIVQTQTGALTVSNPATVLPSDDTIPQQTEGDEYMTLAITPESASSRLKIEVVWNGASNTGNLVISAALFRDAAADAIAAALGAKDAAANSPGQVKIVHDMASPGTTATTFKVRAGVNSAGIITFNGASGARLYGGVMASSITITEYLP